MYVLPLAEPARTDASACTFGCRKVVQNTFGTQVDGLDAITPEDVQNAVDLPEDWLRKMAEKHLSPEEQAEIAALGGFDKLMETLRRAVRDFTERELQTRNHDYMEKFRREMLTEKSFYHLTEEEILRVTTAGKRAALAAARLQPAASSRSAAA